MTFYLSLLYPLPVMPSSFKALCAIRQNVIFSYFSLRSFCYAFSFLVILQKNNWSWRIRWLSQSLQWPQSHWTNDLKKDGLTGFGGQGQKIKILRRCPEIRIVCPTKPKVQPHVGYSLWWHFGQKGPREKPWTFRWNSSTLWVFQTGGLLFKQIKHDLRTFSESFI